MIASTREVELKEAIGHYNRQSPGLGYEFAAEVKRAIERMKSHPEAWHRLSESTRRCRLNRFPYALVYAVDANQLLILAVMQSEQASRQLERPNLGFQLIPAKPIG